MTGFERSVDVQAPPAVIWRLISRVGDWPSWTPTVTSVEALDGLELQVGARFELRQPKLKPAVWTVRSVTAGREFVWSKGGAGLQLTAAHSIAAASSGAARLTISVRLSGVLAPLLWPLAGPLTRQYVTQEVESLKAAAERAACNLA